MSWSDRRKVLALLAAAPLAACGFSPAYAPGGAAHALREAVALAEPKDRNGFDFANRLEDRLGRASAARFRLDWSVQAEPVGAGITPTGAITRYTLKGQARYALVRLEGGQTVTSGSVDSFTSWSTSGSTVATLSAEQDAHRRLMIILADQVVARLIAAAPQ
ncbi:MAG: LPS assembly lipoprotein LptE [Rhodobacterales bacterium]|nr:LPS assembly lipoprotein LptE [Rhodobacterales bacterium]MDX5500612.1 LPS assembly lipoprotein LptE [Rhodobacterales bacterium]